MKISYQLHFVFCGDVTSVRMLDALSRRTCVCLNTLLYRCDFTPARTKYCSGIFTFHPKIKQTFWFVGGSLNWAVLKQHKISLVILYILFKAGKSLEKQGNAFVLLTSFVCASKTWFSLFVEAQLLSKIHERHISKPNGRPEILHYKYYGYSRSETAEWTDNGTDHFHSLWRLVTVTQSPLHITCKLMHITQLVR